MPGHRLNGKGFSHTPLGPGHRSCDLRRGSFGVGGQPGMDTSGVGELSLTCELMDHYCKLDG